MTTQSTPPDQTANISKDGVRLILRDLMHLIAALQRVQTRLRFSLNEAANDSDG